MLAIFVLGFRFTERAGLQDALAEWCANKTESDLKHRHIDEWDVSAITNMSRLFESTPCNATFNADIDQWNVGSVTDMSSMFANTAFNHYLDSWDVSRVVDMRDMFRSAKKFNQSLDMWSLASVQYADRMFEGATLSECNKQLIHLSFEAQIPTEWTYDWESDACACASALCTEEYRAPVCGTDGRTYGNQCYRRRNCVMHANWGVCPEEGKTIWEEYWPYFVVAIVSGVLITGILGCACWKINSNNSKRAKTAADAAKKPKKLKKPDAKPLKMKPGAKKPVAKPRRYIRMPDGRVVTYEEYKKLTKNKKTSKI